MVLVLGQKGDGDAMHSAVLADFYRCLHVRKRTRSSPSDLGNRQTSLHAITRTKLVQRTRMFDIWGNTQRRQDRGCSPLLHDIVSQEGKIGKACLALRTKK